MAALFDLIDAVDTLQVAIHAIGLSADLEQEVPFSAFQDRSAERVHRALHDQLAFDDDAYATTDLLDLLKLVR